MKRNKIIYVSGKYSGSSKEIRENIKIARWYSMRIWEIGYTALCPHLNTEHFEIDCSCVYEDYMAGDLTLITKCDALFMLPKWRESKGANRERTKALLLEKPVFEDLKSLEDWVK